MHFPIKTVFVCKKETLSGLSAKGGSTVAFITSAEPNQRSKKVNSVSDFGGHLV